MRARLRGLVITREFPPYHEGGAGRRLAELVEATRDSVSYTIVTLGPSNTVLKASGNVILHSIRTESYIKYNVSGGIPLIANDLLVLRDIKKLDDYAEALLGKDEYDFYEVVEPFYGAFLDQGITVPKIVTVLHTRQGEFVHSIREITSPSDLKFLAFMAFVGPILDKRGLRGATRIITNSRLVKSEVARIYRFPQERIDPIPNPVHVPHNVDDYLRRPPRSKPIIAYFGRLVYRKSVSTLIHASRILRRSGTDHILLIIGDGPVRAKLQRLASGMDNVIFTGRVGDDLLKRLLPRIDVIVNTSVYEGGHPMAVLEAMAYGAVPVLTAITNHVELIWGTHFRNYLFPQRDPVKLAEKLGQAISDLRSDHESMRSRAIQIVKSRFSPQIIGQLLVNAYLRAIEDAE